MAVLPSVFTPVATEIASPLAPAEAAARLAGLQSRRRVTIGPPDETGAAEVRISPVRSLFVSDYSAELTGVLVPRGSGSVLDARLQMRPAGQLLLAFMLAGLPLMGLLVVVDVVSGQRLIPVGGMVMTAVLLPLMVAGFVALGTATARRESSALRDQLAWLLGGIEAPPG